MFLINDDFYEVKEATGKGRGVFARKPIIKGTIIGDYLGKATLYEEVDYEDFDYMMFFDETFAIIPDRSKPGIHLLNHACDPNCFMYPYKGHMLFVAIKDINPGEELTIHYLYPPQEACDPCDHNCLCGAKNCKGTMHSSKKLHQNWAKFKEEQTKNIKIEKNFIDGYLVPLNKYPESITIDVSFLK